MPIGERGQTGLITYMRTDSVPRLRARPATGPAPTSPDATRPGPRPGQAATCTRARSQDPGRPRGHPARPSPSTPPKTVKAVPQARASTDSTSSIWKRFFASQMADGRDRGDGRSTSPTGALPLLRPRARSSSSTASWPPGRTADGEQGRSCPRLQDGRGAAAAEARRPSRTSPSRRPATREGDAGQGARGAAASAGRAPTRRPSPPSRAGPMSSRRRASSGPTELGMYVTEFLVKHFAKLMEYKFTAHMEEELDEISEGARKGVDSPQGVLRPARDLSQGGRRVRRRQGDGHPPGREVPEVRRGLVVKSGRFGQLQGLFGLSRPASSARAWTRRNPSPSTRSAPSAAPSWSRSSAASAPSSPARTTPSANTSRRRSRSRPGIACPTRLRRQRS
ncbi:MAG: hypothetical protein M0C28_24260 [Candidatus Moduliflexus flocculans]|nr:hypothetical protein [Candidatus Moduliflexus flocculans]